MISRGASTLLLVATRLFALLNAQTITITVYRSACDATTASSAPLSSSSTVPDSAANSGTPFVLQVEAPVGGPTRKRQTPAQPIFITGAGYTTFDASQAQKYVISNGRLTGASGGFVSTSPNITYAPLAIGTRIQNITTTFSMLNSGLRWSNPAFVDGNAAFYATLAGQIIAHFGGAVNSTWSHITLAPRLVSSVAPSTSTSTQSTAQTSTSSSSRPSSASSVSNALSASSSNQSYYPSYTFSPDSSTFVQASSSTPPSTFTSSSAVPPLSSGASSASSSSVIIPTPAPVPATPATSSTTSAVSSSSSFSSSGTGSISENTPGATTISPGTSTGYLSLTSPTPCSFGDPPTFNQDDNFCQVALPFPIYMYNSSSPNTFPGTNGVFCLDQGTQAFQPADLPQAGTEDTPFPKSCLFPYWTDMYLTGESDPQQGIFYQLNTAQTAVTYEWYLARGGTAFRYKFTVAYDSARPGIFTIVYYIVGGQDNGLYGLTGIQGVTDAGQPIHSTFSNQTASAITPGMTLVCDTNLNLCTAPG